MLIHADKEQLVALAKSFYEVSHTMLAIYDANKECLCAYPDTMGAFCAEIRKSPLLTERCLQCDRNALEECTKTRSVYAYRCHMGLVEVAAPIMQSDVVIGYMLFGQITDTRDKSALAEQLPLVAETYGLDLDRLTQGIQKVPFRSPAYIGSISKIVEMCASHIWQNSFMSVRQDAAAHALDLYIREHLTEDLSIAALCQQFNLCRSSLYDLSKHHFGCGISEHVMHCRIEEAKRLLCNGLPVYQVAERVGIPDANYFIRVFKAKTGITPKKF